jgi:hypothetical protein
MQLGDLVFSDKQDDDLGIIIGKTCSGLESWVGNPHAISVAMGRPSVYYVFYSSGRFDGPVFGDSLVPAG